MAYRPFMVLLFVVSSLNPSSLAQNANCPGNLEFRTTSCGCGGQVSAFFCRGTFEGNCMEAAGPNKSCGDGSCGVLQAGACGGGIGRSEPNFHLDLPGKSPRMAETCASQNTFDAWLHQKLLNAHRTIILRGM